MRMIKRASIVYTTMAGTKRQWTTSKIHYLLAVSTGGMSGYQRLGY